MAGSTDKRQVNTDAVAEVRARLDSLYRGDRGDILAFLVRRHPLLDGKRPEELLDEPGGAERIVDLLNRAHAGVAV